MYSNDSCLWSSSCRPRTAGSMSVLALTREYPMKRNVMLTIASLLSILFMTFHITDDIVRGMEQGTLSNLIAVPILVVWLYGTLVLAERRSGDHPPRVAPWVARTCHPHEGVGSRRSDRQVQRGLPLYLDTPRARRFRALLRHPLGARVVGATDTADCRAAQIR
jgi:hypothetical protein